MSMEDIIFGPDRWKSQKLQHEVNKIDQGRGLGNRDYTDRMQYNAQHLAKMTQSSVGISRYFNKLVRAGAFKPGRKVRRP